MSSETKRETEEVDCDSAFGNEHPLIGSLISDLPPGVWDN
jgi:hypothetical protein